MMSFWAYHSLNAIDIAVSKRSGRNYTSRHTARGKMTLPWKCIAMDTIRNNWLITSTRNLDSLLVLHIYREETASWKRPMQTWIWSVHKYRAAGTETVWLYNPIFPKACCLIPSHLWKHWQPTVTAPSPASQPLNPVRTASAYIFKIGSFHSAYYKAV